MNFQNAQAKKAVLRGTTMTYFKKSNSASTASRLQAAGSRRAGEALSHLPPMAEVSSSLDPSDHDLNSLVSGPDHFDVADTAGQRLTTAQVHEAKARTDVLPLTGSQSSPSDEFEAARLSACRRAFDAIADPLNFGQPGRADRVDERLPGVAPPGRSWRSRRQPIH